MEPIPLERKHTRKQRKQSVLERKRYISNLSNRLLEEDANSKQTAKSKKITDYFAECPRISFSQESVPAISEWDPIIKKKQEDIDMKDEELSELKNKREEM